MTPLISPDDVPGLSLAWIASAITLLWFAAGAILLQILKPAFYGYAVAFLWRYFRSPERQLHDDFYFMACTVCLYLGPIGLCLTALCACLCWLTNFGRPTPDSLLAFARKQTGILPVATALTVVAALICKLAGSSRFFWACIMADVLIIVGVGILWLLALCVRLACRHRQVNVDARLKL